MSKAWAEIDCDSQLAIRIFKNHKLMVAAMPYAEDGCTRQMERSKAVKEIRKQIWEQQDEMCIDCLKYIRWDTMELHELLHRGEFKASEIGNSLQIEKSGEISMANSVGLCWSCHHVHAHGDRQVRL